MSGHVAYSTPESELAAMAYAMRMLGSPGMVRWDALRGHEAEQETADPMDDRIVSPPPSTGKLNPLPETLIAHGDNTASISIVRSGKTPLYVTWDVRMGSDWLG